MPFHAQLIAQSIAISTLTVELGGRSKSGIVNVNGMFIFAMPIGHGALSVFSTTEFVVVPTVYVIIRLQLTDADLSGGVSTLKTALP
jgi:hypothetical protein